MQNIKICFPVNDEEFKEELISAFGENVSFYEERSLVGMEIIYVAVIPIFGASLQLIDFVLNHCVKKSHAEIDDVKKKQNRKIEIDNSRICLYDYSPEEAVTIITNLINSNSDGRLDEFIIDDLDGKS